MGKSQTFKIRRNRSCKATNSTITRGTECRVVGIDVMPEEVFDFFRRQASGLEKVLLDHYHTAYGRVRLLLTPSVEGGWDLMAIDTWPKAKDGSNSYPVVRRSLKASWASLEAARAAFKNIEWWIRACIIFDDPMIHIEELDCV